MHSSLYIDFFHRPHAHSTVLAIAMQWRLNELHTWFYTPEKPKKIKYWSMIITLFNYRYVYTDIYTYSQRE